MERRVTRAGMGAVFNFHGCLGRNNRHRGGNHLKQGGSKLVTSDLWLCAAGGVGWRWQWLGLVILEVFPTLSGSVIPNPAVSHILIQKILNASPEVSLVNKEKMVLELLFDVKILL